MKVDPSAIQYKANLGRRVGVYLLNRLVGRIHPVEGGWQYFPKGSKTGGEVHPTLDACKQSLEDL